MDTALIDGKAFAATLRAQIAKDVATLKHTRGITPGLAVVLVGQDPASEVYVKSKIKATAEAGMLSIERLLPQTVSEEMLLREVEALNNDSRVHGILVQLPLPKHISEQAVIQAINPSKDVDGFHAVNAGKLATGQEGFVPCTPLGCLMLLKDTLGEDFSGLNAVVIGRSNIVGKPMAQLLLGANATVTVAHSRTKNLPELVKQADIVVAAIGKPNFVRGAWIKEGATIIDVGINRVTLEDGRSRLTGDVAFEECLGIARAITPVPGGVGPMTIACLLKNTLTSASSTSNPREK